MPIVFIYRY